jgi:hypothetical protein
VSAHAVAEIFGKEWARANAKEICAKRGLGINALPDGGPGEFARMAAKPGFVVGVQGLAIGETQQCGAIIDLGWQLGQANLCLREGDEPSATGLAVLRSVEAKKIRSSISKTVAGVEEEGYRHEQVLAAPKEMKFDLAGSDGGQQYGVQNGVTGGVL